MNDLTTQPPTLSTAYSAAAEITIELAKMLALVAPISMTVEQQELWLRAAADSMEDIRPQEVAAISAELRRSVTRPAQIVPEIARLVSEKRSRSSRPTMIGEGRRQTEWQIDREAQQRRAAARGRDEVNVVWAWERAARIAAGLHVAPVAPPLTRDELNGMSREMVSLGLKHGHLTYRSGQLAEAI